MKIVRFENNMLTVIEPGLIGESRWTISPENIRQHMPMFEKDIAVQLNRVDRESIAAIVAGDGKIPIVISAPVSAVIPAEIIPVPLI